MVYHKGPNVKKSGPKGNRKAKGDVFDMIVRLIEKEPWLSGQAIADRVREKTGAELSARRIQQIRHGVGEKSYSRRRGTGAPYPAARASRS